MHGLTELIDILRAFGTSESVWLSLSYLPLVFGMSYAAGAEEGVDTAPDGDDGDLADPEPEPEFFLKTEGSVYKNREEAARGVAEKDRMIQSYRQLGTPEEIAAMRAEVQQFREFRQALSGQSKQEKQEAFAALDPETRKRYLEFDKHYSPALEQRFLTREDAEKAGYVKVSDLDQHVRQKFKSYQREEQAESITRARLQERGLEPTRARLAMVNRGVEELAETDPEAYRELSQLYTSGRVEEVVDKALDIFLGPKREEASDRNGNERVRDANGRFLNQKLDAVKRTTERLPKAPPAGSARVVPGDEKPDRSTAKARKSLGRAILDRLAGES